MRDSLAYILGCHKYFFKNGIYHDFLMFIVKEYDHRSKVKCQANFKNHFGYQILTGLLEVYHIIYLWAKN